MTVVELIEILAELDKDTPIALGILRRDMTNIPARLIDHAMVGGALLLVGKEL